MKRAAGLLLAALMATPMDAAGPLPDVFPCGRAGSAGGLPTGTDLTRYTVDLARFPDAVCNDGTPAVFYFAPSSRPEDRTKWILFLQGGGGCRDGQTCAERWCSINTNFGMDKMTSSTAKPAIRGDGFLDPSPQNRFGSWNRVLVYYCSSDSWSGTKTSAAQATLSSGGAREYLIHFKGAAIVDAVIETLRGTASRRRRAAAHGVETSAAAPWPDLDDATHVLFAGSSAGGGGAWKLGDRAGETLRASNPELADYRVVIDATYSPAREHLDFSRTPMCASNPAFCRYDTFFQSHWTATAQSFQGLLTDESCLRWHSSVEPGTEWRCIDDAHVILHHITSPFFIRQDLLDSLLGGNFVEAGFGSLGDFATRVESELRDLPAPEEPRAGVPGRFVPQCADHESFTHDRDVFQVKVDGISFHDAVANWLVAIRSYTGSPRPAPDCP